MGIMTRSNKEHIDDCQPPPYSEHWQRNEDVTALEPGGTNKKSTHPDNIRSADDDPRPLVDYKVSPYHDLDLRQRPTAPTPDEVGTVIPSDSQSTSASHRRNRGKISIHSSRSGKDWLRRLRKKHSRKYKDSIAKTPTSGPIFVAIPVPTNPPKVTNQIILNQDTISLSEPDGNSITGAPWLKVTLATTLLEKKPYTICSSVFQRDQLPEASLAHFEVFDIETGHVLSEKPLPSRPSNVEWPSDRKPYKDRKSKRACGSITRRTCTELHPNRTSLLIIVPEPGPSNSSGTERLFAGLCISDPSTLIGRRLGLRLRPKMALWSARTMEELFGFGEALVGGWPDGYYGRLLEMSCSDGDESGWAEFRVVE